MVIIGFSIDILRISRICNSTIDMPSISNQNIEYQINSLEYGLTMMCL